ncbi:MAG: hypothetical protein RR945_01415 [Erysipelotrichaceae bacterium]
MFLQEKELKEIFWKSYNNKGRALRYQFECAIREGNADLVTIETYQGKYQLNSFEFKLYDMKKAMLQAEKNLKYVNKSWIVVPIEKKDLVLNKYTGYLNEKKYIGVIGVEQGGRYSIIYQPKLKPDTISNQEIIKVCMNGL